MFQIRSFLNTDPPHIAKIWREQLPMQGQIPELTIAQAELSLFSKPYFDPEGLVLAFSDDGADSEPLGFVHAAFSKNADGSELDFTQGIVSALKVVDGTQAAEVATALLNRACSYLASKGATNIHAGSCFPHAPFYLGLYGGSEIPGVLEADTRFISALVDAGFESHDQIIVRQRTLTGFRPISGREQQSIRRQFQINAVMDPVAQTWWEHCVFGIARREKFSIFNKRDQVVCGDVSFWDMKPMAAGDRTRGVYGLNVPAEFRRSGIATFLLCDALKRLMQEGIEMVEAQTRESESAANRVFEKIGFEEKFRGLLFSRTTE